MKFKNLCLLSIVLIGTFALASCKKEEKEEAVTLTVSPTSIEAPGTSKEAYTVTITTTGMWSAASGKDFVTLSPSWGNGTAEMTITVDKNRTEVARTAEVIVTVDGVGSETIMIHQGEGIIEEIGQRKFYVTPDGSDAADGMTWATATTFAKAYDEAVAGESIHFSAGTYVPSTPLDGTEAAESKNNTFYIGKNITLVGGYPENPKPGDAPNPAANKTILSGVLSEGSNVYHVVVLGAPVAENETTIVRGFTISGGNGTGCPSPAVNGVNIAGGRAGAIAIQGNTHVIVEDCSIGDNSAKEAGAVHVNLNKEGSAIFKRCSFMRNVSASHSGALGVTKSVVYIYDSTFDGNTAESNGAAIMIDGHWSQTSGDQAYLYVFNSTFSNNSCKQVGSAIYGIWGDHIAIVNCTITGNSSTGNGSAVGGHYAEIDIINSTIANNSAAKWGGVVSKTNNATIRIYNSIISGNTGSDGMENIAKENDAANDIILRTSIAGTDLYNASGASSAVNFDAATMLGTLSDNGGNTYTMPLVGDSNPAITNGLSATQIATLVKDTIVPEKDRSVAEKDQRGVARTQNHMGACSK